jgi:hypothetical protein
VADNKQYLRIGLLGVDYLLPNNTTYVIEKRETLEVNDAPGAVIAAWQTTSAGRTPAYSLDADLNPLPRHAWQRAVFLRSGAQSLGLIADELQLMPAGEVRVERFTPPGPAPTTAGHLFSGAWVRAGHTPVLMFDLNALIAHLHRLEDAA